MSLMDEGDYRKIHTRIVKIIPESKTFTVGRVYLSIRNSINRFGCCIIKNIFYNSNVVLLYFTEQIRTIQKQHV